MDQSGKVANPAFGQLNRKNDVFLSPFAPDNSVSRDGFRRTDLKRALVSLGEAFFFKKSGCTQRYLPTGVREPIILNSNNDLEALFYLSLKLSELRGEYCYS